MLGFLTALTFKIYQPNFPINIAKLEVFNQEPPSPGASINRILKNITSDKAFTGPVCYLQLPFVLTADYSENISKALGSSSGYVVLPAENIYQSEYGAKVQQIDVTNIDDLQNQITNTCKDKENIVIGQPSVVNIHNDIRNYWVPAVWNSFVTIVIFVALTTCSITYFAQISVQTKYAKRD